MSRGLVLSAACLLACGGSDPEPPWTVAADARASALLGIWASSADDVWVVGTEADDGMGPAVLHYDGTDWTKLDSGLRDVDLWWVYGFEGGPVFMSGSNGTIVRFQNGAFETFTTPGTQIVFGMYGATANDVWAVGGSFVGGGFAWRFDGSTWIDQPGLPDEVTAQGTLFKVNGTASDDIRMVGTTGVTLHWNGTELQRLDAGTDATLLSVATNGELTVAVGGNFDGVLYELENGSWVSKIATGGPRLTGVSVSETGEAYAVGQSGAILKRTGGTWAFEQPRKTDENLHAAWIDTDGGVWAVGGQFDTPPYEAGVLLHKGAALKGSVP